MFQGSALGRRRWVRFSLLTGLLVWGTGVRAQDPFPAGIEGELYLCPRIDRIPASEGGPLVIQLDGVLDEVAWERAQFQKWSNPAGNPLDFLPPEEDLDLSWAAVSDGEFLYVAFKVVDEARQSVETFTCNVWRDDSVELYIDALNNGPTCPNAASCYGVDDAQISIGADQIGKHNPVAPELLEFGGVAGGGGCDFGPPAPDLAKGVILELADAIPGYQGEIAIALETTGNNGDGTPSWKIEPLHGEVIGWNIHVNDDDNSGERDHKVLWSKHEVQETAWQNPGAFGKLQFITPGKALVDVVRDLPEALHNGGSATVTITVTPRVGIGAVVLSEDLPPGLAPSAPSHEGVVAGNAVRWTLPAVEEELVLSYTLTVAEEANDAALPAMATVDGEPIRVKGDTVYTGSPFSLMGFIKMWSHLGPLGGSTCPLGAELGRDWIVNQDATITEKDIRPFPGMVTRPRYGGTGLVVDGTGARSTGLALSGGRLVTDQFPSWKGAISGSSTIVHSSPEIHGYHVDDSMTLSCVYITNPGAPIDTRIGFGSADALQVLLDGVELGQAGFCRDWGGPDEEQDTVEVALPAGESRLIVKSAAGLTRTGFRLRFQDPRDPSLPGLMFPRIRASLESTGAGAPGKVIRRFSNPALGLGETVEVSLDVRMPSATEVSIREALPAGASASDISPPGRLNGEQLEWDLSAVQSATLTYRLAAAHCAGDLPFARSAYSYRSGAATIEAQVSGGTALPRSYSSEALGAPWTQADIGATGGSSQRTGPEAVFIQGTGAGIRGQRDELHFASFTGSGDYEVSAAVDCLNDPLTRGSAGLMVRNSLEDGAANIFFGLTPKMPVGARLAGTLTASYRRDTGKTTVSFPISELTDLERRVEKLPIFLRIKKSGATLSLGRRYAEEADFTTVLTRDIGPAADTTKLALVEKPLVGLAVTAGADPLTVASFIAVAGSLEQGRVFRRGNVNSDARINLTDAVNILGFLFLGELTVITCKDAADSDDDGRILITDAIVNLGYQFLGDAAPPDPGPVNCGPDPTPDNPLPPTNGDLGCEGDDPCPTPL